MAERYEQDDYSCEEYSSESINVSYVCSWSINKISDHRPAVNLVVENFRFNSAGTRISDEKLHALVDRLRQAENGNLAGATS